MTQRPLTIVQVSTFDVAGGAEKVAYRLHEAYRARGHKSLLVVGCKRSEDPDVIEIGTGVGRPRDPVVLLKAVLERFAGVQYLGYPNSHQIPQLVGRPIDALHLHNLHGGYFDVAALSNLSRQARTLVSLHDCWLLTGHCAHPFGCERWQAGCGKCPDLTIYPSIRADGTRINHWRKRRHVGHADLTLTVPSRWLEGKVEQSYLASKPRFVAYNGIDLSVFNPGSKDEARARLGLPLERRIVLFSAQGGLANRWKDTGSLLAALRGLFAELPQKHWPLLLALGGDEIAIDDAAVQENTVFRSFVTDEKTIAGYYRSADVLAYSSRADNCPLVILEALACGLPVVATGVGGIPELVEDRSTGFVVNPGDVDGLKQALRRLLENGPMRKEMSARAVATARDRFDLEEQAEAYLEWYERDD